MIFPIFTYGFNHARISTGIIAMINEFLVLSKMSYRKPYFFLYTGMLMYEIHMPLILLAKLEMESGKLSKEDAKKEFRRAILNLKMSLEILKYEPEGSFGKNVYHGAKGSLVPLESFISSL